jgi:hypothetical protein
LAKWKTGQPAATPDFAALFFTHGSFSCSKMKIKHYPGKAVVNDPAWLEMDISNDIRGRQYEANWEDAQKNLSSTNSSGSNSWDKYSEGTLSSKLGQYQNMLDELAQEEQLYAVPNKLKDKPKYHSEKCLSRINNPMANYYLPSQTKIQKTRSFKEETKPPPKPKPRTKLPAVNLDEEYKNVINDLEKQMKKSVRFDEEADEEIQERVSEWIDDQNRHILEDTVLTVTEELPKKVRQRIPPRNLTPSPSQLCETPPPPPPPDDDVYNLYKDGLNAPVLDSPPSSKSDFSIPRPKLIVPVHTYAVRRRRTGNLQCAGEEVGKGDSGEFFFCFAKSGERKVAVFCLRYRRVGAPRNGQYFAGCGEDCESGGL